MRELYVFGGGGDDKGNLEGVEPVDHLLVTTSAQIDWSHFLGFVKSKCTTYPLSFPEGEFEESVRGALVQGTQGSVEYYCAEGCFWEVAGVRGVSWDGGYGAEFSVGC